MKKDIVKNLQKGRGLLLDISREHYCDKSIPPYYSSIGGHIRHILDMFNCIFSGYHTGTIDLTRRDRNINVETFPSYGIEYLDAIVQQVLSLNDEDLNVEIELIDNLGSGTCMVKTTLGAALAQAQSHAIHHYATIGYMLHHLGVTLKDDNFGLNPTTPKVNVTKKS